MKQETKRTGVSRSQKTFFGVGDFGFTLMANIDTFFAQYFFTNIANFQLGVVTIMTTISAVIDAILSAFWGPFLNKVKPKKWGRYRSWLILTPWMVPILYAMQFVSLGNGKTAAIFATLAMITSRMAWNIPFIANLSMINIVGKTTEERMSLSTTRAVWTSLASVLYSFIGPFTVAAFAKILGDQNAYAATAFAFACLMAAGYFAHFKMFKGYEMSGEEEQAMLAKQAKDTEAPPKVKVMKVIKTNSHLRWLFMSSITKYVVMFLVTGFAIYYFKYVGNNEGLMTSFMFVYSLLGVIAPFIAKFLVSKTTAKKTVLIAYSGMTVLTVAAFLFYSNVTVATIAMCAAMFFMMLSNTCEPEMYSACAVYSTKKMGIDVTGSVMGLLTVPLKIGVISRGIIISACLAIAGFSSEIADAAATPTLQRGISIGFMIIPAIVIGLGAVMLAIGYKIDSEKV